MDKNFSKSITHKLLDIVNLTNPLIELCIVKTYEYKTKYKMRLSKKLKEFFLKYYLIKKDKLNEIQIIHYGKIIFPLDELDDFYNEVFTDYNEIKFTTSPVNPNQLKLEFTS